jgi:MFS family permease
MMTSICKKLWQFILAQGVLGGISAGMTFAPSMAAVGQYFFKKRGAAMGLGIAGSSLGGVVLPIVLNELLHKPSLGFGWSTRILGFLILAVLGPSSFAIKARLPPRQSAFFLPSAFKDPAYCTFIAACFFLVMGMFPPIFFIPSYALTQGMGSKLAFYLVSILNAASFPGRIIPGILGDKYGRFNMLFFSGISTGILCLCWQACHSNAAIIVFTAFFGFCSGSIVSGLSIGLASIPKDPRNIGTFMGMGMAIASVATLVGPPASGAMVNSYHSFTQVAIFSGVVCLIGAVLIVPVKLFSGHGILARA